MAEPFNPEAHQQLIDLGQRLQELSGDAAYKAGRQYLGKGAVKAATVMGTTAYATVSGSTDYRVSLGFGEKPSPHCTCPAHRRNRYCKHIVALSLTLLERPASVTCAEPPPDLEQDAAAATAKKQRAKARNATTATSAISGGPATATKSRSRSTSTAARAAQQAPGLATVERVLLDLAETGMPALEDEERAGILRDAGAVVRARKLRRLANLLGELEALTDEVRARRVFEQAPNLMAGPSPALAIQIQQLVQQHPAAIRTLGMLRAAAIRGEASPDLERRFADLLRDCWLTFLATKAALADPEAHRDEVEDLAGKTWRDEELPLVEGLQLLEVGRSVEQTREFSIDSRYAVDLTSVRVYVLRTITPRSGRSHGFDLSAPPVWQRVTPASLLTVREARIYAGPPPQRLKLVKVEHLPLRREAIEELVARVPGSASALRRRLGEHLATPIGYGEPLALFRPSGLLCDGTRYAALDEHGALVRLAMTEPWAKGLAATVTGDAPCALAGRVELTADGLQFAPFAAIGAGLRGVEGPVYT